MHDNIIVNKTLAFSRKLILFCEKLRVSGQFVISNQLLKSGTSVGANVFEAQQAESKADFIHKMKVAIKEAYETKYWLLLCEDIADRSEVEKLKAYIDEIVKVLSKIIATTKWRMVY